MQILNEKTSWKLLYEKGKKKIIPKKGSKYNRQPEKKEAVALYTKKKTSGIPHFQKQATKHFMARLNSVPKYSGI